MVAILGESRDRTPAVAMKPTAFATYTLNAVGAANAAIRIAGGDVMAQRVVIVHETAGQFAFVTDEPNELNGVGGVTPAGAYTVGPVEVTSFVVAPDQALFAAASVANLRLAVSVSAVVPVPPKGSIYAPPQPATFQTRVMRILGTPNATTRIVRASTKPQRVVVRHGVVGQRVFIASGGTGSLDGPAYAAAGPVPFAFEVPPNADVLFVTAPGQSLDAVASAVLNLSISVSEISLMQVLGPTGIPGPGGEG